MKHMKVFAEEDCELHYRKNQSTPIQSHIEEEVHQPTEAEENLEVTVEKNQMKTAAQTKIMCKREEKEYQ